jgi:hypothetical protein
MRRRQSGRCDARCLLFKDTRQACKDPRGVHMTCRAGNPAPYAWGWDAWAGQTTMHAPARRKRMPQQAMQVWHGQLRLCNMTALPAITRSMIEHDS